MSISSSASFSMVRGRLFCRAPSRSGSGSAYPLRWIATESSPELVWENRLDRREVRLMEGLEPVKNDRFKWSALY